MLSDIAFPARFRTRLKAAWALGRRGEPDRAASLAKRILERARGAADRETIAFAHQQLAWFGFQTSRLEEGSAHIHAARQIWQDLRQADGLAWTAAMQAWLLLEAGLTDEAGQGGVEALRLAREPGVRPSTLCFATNVLGVVFWYSSQLERALELCEQAVAQARDLGDPIVLGWWLINLAGVHADRAIRARREGDAALQGQATELALTLNDEAIALAETAGDAWGLRLGLCNAAEYLCTAERTEEALRYLGRHEQAGGELGPRSLGHFLYTKAQVLIQMCRFEEALHVCEAALVVAERTENVTSAHFALRYLSEIHELNGRHDLALAYFKRFHEAFGLFTSEKAQRRARIAEIHYETNRYRELADKAEAQVAALARTLLLDPLTGIANRRAFDELMTACAARERGFAIAMVDLDHFKQINDRFSHLVGDEVLRRVADILSASCGPGDHAARLGGEEFALVIDSEDPAGTRRLCETVRQRIEGADWAAIHPDLRVTMSIGLADCPPREDVQAGIARADARLYAAKAAGRNRVVWLDGLDRREAERRRRQSHAA
ncbi:hypothetical protein GCM10011390_29130 [Aureimonas endophytica]|uniref:diguanylate cyclase n=1 Tax=Aureimonas endophytica TaxID=2027858 RepID=A0A916ZPV5_9HYPH|nr:GGDEF domain-containing protein [Aureimonas endophytica]GGE08214.1 hypothetical protein GCM10011390_29130 [Aureimonas endophytica]